VASCCNRFAYVPLNTWAAFYLHKHHCPWLVRRAGRTLPRRYIVATTTFLTAFSRWFCEPLQQARQRHVRRLHHTAEHTLRRAGTAWNARCRVGGFWYTRRYYYMFILLLPHSSAYSSFSPYGSPTTLHAFYARAFTLLTLPGDTLAKQPPPTGLRAVWFCCLAISPAYDIR